MIPVLRKSNRCREFNEADQETIDKIIYMYLFLGKSFRAIDKECFESGVNNGWRSMSILHFIGITKEFKGIFKEINIDDALIKLENLRNEDYNFIIDSLKNLNLGYNYNNSCNENNTRLKEVDSKNIATLNINDIDEKEIFINMNLTIESINCRKERHNKLVRKFAGFLEEKGFQIFEGRIDCLGIKNKEIAIIAEIKTLNGTEDDEYRQVIKAFSQLYYYEEFCMGDFNKLNSEKVVVFEKSISNKHKTFLEKNNIQVIYLKNKEFHYDTKIFC